eukprot:g13728.t1
MDQYDGEEHVAYEGDGGLEDGGYAEGDGAASGATPGKRRKKRAYKKAPDAPRRGRSAYVLFSMEARESVKNGLPEGAKVTEVMKGIAARWRELGEAEKAEWTAKAALDKDRYEQELAMYDGPLKVPNKRAKKDPLAPKRAMSAFLHFSQSMRPRLRETYPEAKNMDMSKMLGQEWNRMSEEEKEPYKTKANDDTMRYREAMTVWKDGGADALADHMAARGDADASVAKYEEEEADGIERT